MHPDLGTAARILEPIWSRRARPRAQTSGDALVLRSVSFRHDEGTEPAKVYESDDLVVVECEVPGCRPEDVDILLAGRVLSISVRGPQALTESFFVPKDVDRCGMHAELSGHRLRISMPARAAEHGLGAAWYRKAT
jgi:HSP20 family molecular chaperone IbpA